MNLFEAETGVRKLLVGYGCLVCQTNEVCDWGGS